MEPSDFNLQQSVDNYINIIKNEGNLTSSDVTELTAHLYDATEELQKHRLSQEEAFMIACKRLGSQKVINEEYSKVNVSINLNKVWAYLFIGFNLLYAVPSLILMGIAVFYSQVHHNFQDSNTSAFIITVFHLLFIAFVCYVVSKKNSISAFIEKQLKSDTLRIVLISFLPLLLVYIGKSLLASQNIYSYLNSPVYLFHSSFAEFSFYLAVLSCIAGVLSLIFSINNPEKFTLKTLFAKPSYTFLICFGVFIELLSASTRSIRVDSILISAILFGISYFGASWLITCYNKHGNINKYLIVFLSSGFLMETAVGVIADMKRGDTYFTVYFVFMMLFCIALGRLLGLRRHHASSPGHFIT